MNRMPLPNERGRHELLYVVLLVVPLAAIGFFLPAIEVLVDDPEPVVTPTPNIVVATPATPSTSPVTTPQATPRH